MRRRLSGAPAVPFLKSYIVFNVEQIAGLPEHYYAKPGAKRPEPQRIEHAEQFFAATKESVKKSGVRNHRMSLICDRALQSIDPASCSTRREFDVRQYRTRLFGALLVGLTPRFIRRCVAAWSHDRLWLRHMLAGVIPDIFKLVHNL
jgi:hypothetical protein